MEEKAVALFETGEYSLVSLALPPAMPFEAWKPLGAGLSVVGSAYRWWLGDWMVYGENTYGDKYGDKYEEALEMTGLAYQTLANIRWIALRFPVSRRRENLSWSHHEVVASFPDEEAEKWLDLAEEQRWSVMELRQAIRGEQQTKEAPSFALAFALLMAAIAEHKTKKIVMAATALKDSVLGGDLPGDIIVEFAVAFLKRLRDTEGESKGGKK